MRIGDQYNEDNAHPDISSHVIQIVLEMHRGDAARGLIAHHMAIMDPWVRKAGAFNDELVLTSSKIKMHAHALAKAADELHHYEQTIADNWRGIRKCVAEDAERLGWDADNAAEIKAQFATRIHELYQVSHLEMGMGYAGIVHDDDDDESEDE